MKTNRQRDKSYYVCECKYTKDNFSISPKYYEKLENEIKLVEKKRRKKGGIKLIGISPLSFVQNSSYGILFSEINLEDFLV